MRVKGFIMTAVVGLASISAAQNWSQEITYQTEGASLQEILADISKEASASFTAHKTTAADVYAISVEEMTLQDLLNTIADASEADWKRTETGYVLETTNERWNKALERDNTAIAKEMQAQHDRTVNQQNGQSRRRRGNADVLRAAKEIGWMTLASMRDGERRVWTTSPNRMQSALPRGAAEIANQILTNDLSRLQAELDKQTDERRRRQLATLIQSRQPGRIKSYFVAHRNGLRWNLSLSMTDSNGANVRSSNTSLSVGRNGSISMDGGSKPKLSNETVGMGNLFQNPGRSYTVDVLSSVPMQMRDLAEAEVRFVEAQTLIEQRVGNLATGAEITLLPQPGNPFSAQEPPNTTARDAMRSRVLSPDANEPLAWFVGPALVAHAKVNNQNLIAHLPDRAFEVFAETAAASAQGFDPASSRLGEVLTKMESESGNYLMPRFLSESRLTRLNRSALAKLLAAIVKNNALRLADLADYAPQVQMGAFDANLDNLVASRINSQAGSDLQRAEGNYEALLLWGGLDAGTKNRMRDGTGVRLSIAPRGSAIGNELLYHSTDGPRYISPDRSSADRTVARTARNLESQLRRRERTDLFPTGLPQGTTVTLQQRSNDLVMASVDEHGRTSALSPSALGSHLARLEHPSQAERRNRMAQYRVFQPYQQESYTLTFTYADGAVMTRTLQDRLPVEGTTAGTLDSMPDSFRQAVERAKQRTMDALNRTQTGRERPSRRRDGGRVPPASP